MNIRQIVAKQMRDEGKTDLSDLEIGCLEALADHRPFFMPFRQIADYIEMPLIDVRVGCHGLASRGLAAYERSLLTEDGSLAGAGYGITAKGEKLWAALAPSLLEKSRALMDPREMFSQED